MTPTEQLKKLVAEYEAHDHYRHGDGLAKFYTSEALLSGMLVKFYKASVALLREDRPKLYTKEVGASGKEYYTEWKQEEDQC